MKIVVRIGATLLVSLLAACGVIEGWPRTGRLAGFDFFSVGNFGNTTFISFNLRSDGTLVQSSSILAVGTVSSSPTSVAVNSTGSVLYSANFNSNNIGVYSIAPMADDYPSVLAAVTTPVSAGTGTSSVALSPNGHFLYSTAYSLSTNNVVAYTVASNGALTPLDLETASVNPSWIAIHPNGNYAYVTNQGSSNISAFTLDSSSGAIAALAGGPYDTDSNPTCAVVDPSGQNLLVANLSGGTLQTFRIAANGTLTNGSTIATEAGPARIAMHQTLNFVYVSNSETETISGYSLDSSTGALTAIPGSPFSLTGQTEPYALAINQAGTFLVAAWQGTGYLTSFRIDQSTGALAAAGAPIYVGIYPRSMVSYRLFQLE